MAEVVARLGNNRHHAAAEGRRNETGIEEATKKVAIVIAPAVAGVHANIEARPAKDRHRGEDRRRRAARKVRGDGAHAEAQKGNRGK